MAAPKQFPACGFSASYDIIDISIFWWTIMAQLIVRNLDESIKRRLQRRARRSGRSLEGEVREILRAAAVEASKAHPAPGFGTSFSAYFKNVGADIEPFTWDESHPPKFE
jgi:hypothetical protein